MSIFVFSNNASSLLASAILPTDTELAVQSGQGILFPAIIVGQIAPISIEDVDGDIEIVYATGRVGDTLVIERAQEGTAALAFASGSRVEQRFTAGAVGAFLQKEGGDTLSNTTTLSGILELGSGGSIQGGEIAGIAIRSQPGDTSNQILVPVGEPATEGGSILLTTANLNQNLPAGSSMVMSGMIVLWNGLSTNIPAGWVLCNGNNGTPDLRDKFILGGGGTLATTGNYAFTTDGASAGTPTVGSASALTAANLPPHTHGSTIYVGSAGQKVGPTGSAPGGYYFEGGVGNGVAVNWSTDQGPGTSSPVSFTGMALPAHTHTATSPPYVAVFFIMKS